MSKFSTKQVPARNVAKSPVKARISTVARTYNSGVGAIRDAKSELYLLGITNMVREETFYEKADARDKRFIDLVHQIAQSDPEWLTRFIPFLRSEALLRSAPVVAAAEYVAAAAPNGRAVVNAALQRADEPAELLAYWHQNHGRSEPIRLKRGVADAVQRLYNEFSALKYDGLARAWRMGDVIERVHPRPQDARQNALFNYLLTVRHNPDAVVLDESLGIIRGVREWEANGRPLPLPKGVTWERLSSDRKMGREAWEAVIPQMGYQALLMNLRNFDEAGVSDEVKAQVAIKLSDPDEVAKSRQFPIRFFTAYNNVRSLDWGKVLETALKHSIQNVPELKGRTLILVDVSGSMDAVISAKSEIMLWQLAALFGTALALRAEDAEVYAYSSGGGWHSREGVASGRRKMNVRKGDSILRDLPQYRNWPNAGGGTDTFGTLDATFNKHDRVILLTDEQADPFYGHSALLKKIPSMYTFNLAGYRVGHAPSGNDGKHTFGGLTDAAFRMIPLLDKGRNTDWPF